MKGLRNIREKLRLTLQEVEDLTGVDLNAISRYERGVIEPSSKTALKIAKGLGVSVDELLNGPEAKEFEVKIVMGVKNLTGLAGMEVADNSFIFGVQDDKPQIHLAGKIMIGTPEEREAAKALLLQKFERACWMFDHRDDEKAGE